jgi:hypothetical protein
VKGSIFSLLLFFGFILAGCNPESSVTDPAGSDKLLTQTESAGDITLGKFSPETLQELAAARAGTARYHNIANAIADGYVDINVVVPGMGVHYLRPENLNATFDPGMPELLVYQPKENGGFRLVAVEYAVPVALSTNAPEGYTGDDDVWGIFAGAPGPEDDLWTLHAWVWYNNPTGMFNPINPLLLT